MGGLFSRLYCVGPCHEAGALAPVPYLPMALTEIHDRLSKGGVITTRGARGSVGRFPAFAELNFPHGSSRDQQLESHR